MLTVVAFWLKGLQGFSTQNCVQPVIALRLFEELFLKQFGLDPVSFSLVQKGKRKFNSFSRNKTYVINIWFPVTAVMPNTSYNFQTWRSSEPH